MLALLTSTRQRYYDAFERLYPCFDWLDLLMQAQSNSLIRGLTSSIFLCMSCSWSSHSCISESKLSISSGLSCPQPRPLCSSPRCRSIAAMTQATQYPEAFLNGNFPFPCATFPVRGHLRVASKEREDGGPGNTEGEERKRIGCYS